MQITPKQVEKLLKGNYTFSLWSFSVFVTRLKLLYNEGGKANVLPECAKQLNDFVAKYHQSMGVDYKIIEGL